jgi:hypothetical protein
LARQPRFSVKILTNRGQRRSITQDSEPGVYLNERCLLRYGRNEGLVLSVTFQHVPMHNNAIEPGRASGQVVCRVGQRSLQRGTLDRPLVMRGRMIDVSIGALFRGWGPVLVQS